MIGSSYFTQNYATDFEAIEAAAQNLKWSFGDQKYLGYTYMCNRDTSVGAPVDPYLEQVVNVATYGSTIFMFSGRITETVGDVQHQSACLALVGDNGGQDWTLSETFIAAANALASALGYFLHDGVTPAWVVAKGARIANPAAVGAEDRESFLECKRAKLTAQGVATESVYASRYSYALTLDFPSSANHTIYTPTFDNTVVYQVSQYMIGYRWNSDISRAVYYMTEMAYEVDLENMLDIVKTLANFYSNPAETTQLTPRVEALETAVAGISGTGPSSISSLIAAEAAARLAGDAALADVLDEVPAFGSKVKNLVEASNRMNEYIPRM